MKRSSGYLKTINEGQSEEESQLNETGFFNFSNDTSNQISYKFQNTQQESPFKDQKQTYFNDNYRNPSKPKLVSKKQVVNIKNQSKKLRNNKISQQQYQNEQSFELYKRFVGVQALSAINSYLQKQYDPTKIRSQLYFQMQSFKREKDKFEQMMNKLKQEKESYAESKLEYLQNKKIKTILEERIKIIQQGNEQKRNKLEQTTESKNIKLNFEKQNDRDDIFEIIQRTIEIQECQRQMTNTLNGSRNNFDLLVRSQQQYSNSLHSLSSLQKQRNDLNQKLLTKQNNTKGKKLDFFLIQNRPDYYHNLLNQVQNLRQTQREIDNYTKSVNQVIRKFQVFKQQIQSLQEFSLQNKNLNQAHTGKNYNQSQSQSSPELQLKIMDFNKLADYFCMAQDTGELQVYLSDSIENKNIEKRVKERIKQIIQFQQRVKKYEQASEEKDKRVLTTLKHNRTDFKWLIKQLDKNTLNIIDPKEKDQGWQNMSLAAQQPHNQKQLNFHNDQQKDSIPISEVYLDYMYNLILKRFGNDFRDDQKQQQNEIEKEQFIMQNQKKQNQLDKLVDSIDIFLKQIQNQYLQQKAHDNSETLVKENEHFSKIQTEKVSEMLQSQLSKYGFSLKVVIPQDLFQQLCELDLEYI